jgi:hypothetical protein
MLTVLVTDPDFTLRACSPASRAHCCCSANQPQLDTGLHVLSIAGCDPLFVDIARSRSQTTNIAFCKCHCAASAPGILPASSTNCNLAAFFITATLAMHHTHEQSLITVKATSLTHYVCVQPAPAVQTPSQTLESIRLLSHMASRP